MEHYYSENPESSIKTRLIEVNLLGNDLRFITSSGVFSKKRIDPGTELLINNAILPNKGVILDLGCGYGAIGIAIKKAYPLLRVILTDINKRAVMLARKNAELNNVSIEVYQGFLFDALPFTKPFFDSILVNPPISAGRDLCLRIIDESYEWLKKGSLQLVARHRKGGKYLMQYMKQVFGNVSTIARSKGFHVYYSVKE